MNEVRGTQADPAGYINPGALYAMGLIDEASHALIAHYRKHVDPNVITEALAWFGDRVGQASLDNLLLAFVTKFPSTSVYVGEQEPAQWLRGATDGIEHRAAALEELLLLWTANANPAFGPFQELFDDSDLAAATVYPKVVEGFRDYFGSKPSLGPGLPNLFDMLRAPVLAAPQSLSGQLEFIRGQWVTYLGETLRDVILAEDILREEEVAIWMRFHPPSTDAGMRQKGHAHFHQDQHSEVPQFASSQEEYEKFSPDKEWMPNTVMVAKSTYVWLAQLSKQYGRPVHRLNEIPDEELDSLARQGMNALWLIGIWERSRASRIIKRYCGNGEAVASAYSLYDYTIAAELGGEAAYTNLRDRAFARGIRLASDMVPNHMGIDSSWVIDHPEWFLSRPDCPYPAYQFSGPNLSGDHRVEIKIEDHYYEQTDAAVVFRRRDNWTGDIRYVYHGNDGTSFPWNDTAQLNYLSAAVREQVIQTILHVARLFPIIRFDAAMTLAKRHIQRLWFPSPGSAGAIPSRAECGMTTAEFDAAIPEEFWREVVDRVATEVPGTLLLAEAFWLMEGYFVRTLGMHRVYNSAFMNMMRDEENAKYRQVLKSTLEFDPGIMKRYVNFMSNPDERTAIDQFGSDDKYFGVTTMMATLPGLPMFGHGQVQGLTEKYGMEYFRPRYDESPNTWLVDRHQREIAPLLHNRALFAESDNFLLYDLWKDDGTVDENVFAYSNRRGNERALIIYHNKFASTRGTVHNSVAYQDKATGMLRQRSLQEGLGLPADGSILIAYRNITNGLEYLRRASDLTSSGFHIDLEAYQHTVLLNWRELTADAEHPWDRLHDALHGAGVESLDEALLGLKLVPLHEAILELLAPEMMGRLAAAADEAAILAKPRKPKNRPKPEPAADEEELLQPLLHSAVQVIDEARKIYLAKVGLTAQGQAGLRNGMIAHRLEQQIRSLIKLPQLAAGFSFEGPAPIRTVLPGTGAGVVNTKVWGLPLAYLLLEGLAQTVDADQTDEAALALFEKLRLRDVFARAFAALGLKTEDSWRAAARIRLLFLSGCNSTEQQLPGVVPPDDQELETIFGFPPKLWKDPDFRWLIGLHDDGGKQYFVQESQEELLWWCQLPCLLKLTRTPSQQELLLSLKAKLEDATTKAKIAKYQLAPETSVSKLGED
ncbi:alpha-amylase family glycosyl hydrolase [Edaphobacter paludis]|uniref:Alpha-amylase family glycosyl hydrolase n=1 Tax=Edaphobacter paludis TaxID=3035702 RepID=A0AAU7DDF2_9BACT